MSKGKILLGLLAGIAAGSLLGILFAPDKGYETRKKIAKKGKDYADGLTEKLNDFMEEITDKFESVVKKTQVSDEKETGSEGSGN